MNTAVLLGCDLRNDGAVVDIRFPDALSLTYIHTAGQPDRPSITPCEWPAPAGRHAPADIIVLGDLMPGSHRLLREVLGRGGSPIVIRPCIQTQQQVELACRFQDDFHYCEWLSNPAAAAGSRHVLIHPPCTVKMRHGRVRLEQDDLRLMPPATVRHANDNRILKWNDASMKFVFYDTRDSFPTLWVHATTNVTGSEPDPNCDALLLGSRALVESNLRHLADRVPARVLVAGWGVREHTHAKRSFIMPLHRYTFTKNERSWITEEELPVISCGSFQVTYCSPQAPRHAIQTAYLFGSFQGVSGQDGPVTSRRPATPES